jgi:hypothetical protein
MSAPPPDEATPAQRWFALALEDLAAARVLLAAGSVALRIVGFLSQQAAEKALKAGLFAASIAAPKIHGLHSSWLATPTVMRRWWTQMTSTCSIRGSSKVTMRQTSRISAPTGPRSCS